MRTMEAVARVLARQQLLLVLDNCQHVIGAAAELCTGLQAAWRAGRQVAECLAQRGVSLGRQQVLLRRSD